MIEEKKYDKKFYESQADGSYASARIILPMVQQWLSPTSVLDVGCGVGTWLRVWQSELGVQDVFGIDGDYVRRDQLQIPPSCFVSRDLKAAFDLGRKFDLVMSLEVGEHLPTESSEAFVQNLTRHGDAVLFSAALLGQHGTYHINEQLPEFWARHFSKFGFSAVDIVRDKVWNDDRVEWWYRQNIVLYVRTGVLEKYPELSERAKHTNPECLVRIHPLLWRFRNQEVEERSAWFSFIRWKLSSVKKKIFGR
jgi:SAM-dependent methyltransferase